MIRVLRVLTRLNVGGPARHAAVLSTQLDPARFSTCVVVGEPEAAEGDFSDLISSARARLIRLERLRRPIHLWNDLLAWWQLVRIVWNERPQIIHTHMAKAGTLGRLAGLCYNTLGPGRGRTAKALLVHTFHGHVLDGYFPPWLSRGFMMIERWLARRTDCLVAVSSAVRNQLLEKSIGRVSQWRVIPLGVELSAYTRLPPPPGAPRIRIGLIARLVPVKHPSLFLQALERLVRGEPPQAVSAVVVGDGPLRGALEREAVARGLTDVVRFIGWQRQVSAVYADLDIVCLTSWNEGSPVALIEAMAAGRAVAATAIGGVRELLGQGTEEGEPPPGAYQIVARGALVRPGDVAGLASALERLAGDVMLRRSLGESARAYVQQQFSAERLVADIESLYETLRAAPVVNGRGTPEDRSPSRDGIGV
jgi:glycosyltransferase involved in cell wall biosynthesis